MLPGMSSLGLRLFAVLAAVGALIGVGGCEEAKEKPFLPVTQSARLLGPPLYPAELLGDLWPGDSTSSPAELMEVVGAPRGSRSWGAPSGSRGVPAGSV